MGTRLEYIYAPILLIPNEAPNAEAIREAARQAGIPADSIIEVGELQANGVTGAVRPERFALE